MIGSRKCSCADFTLKWFISGVDSNMSVKERLEWIMFFSLGFSYRVNSSDRENRRGQFSIGHENGRSCKGVFDGRFI